MEYKKNILILGSLSSVLFLSILSGCYFFEDLCSQNTHETLALSVLFYSFIGAIFLVILYFLQEKVFRSWLRFTKWYISIATVAIFLSENSHGGWGIGNIFAPEIVIAFSAGIFFLASLALIIVRSCSKK